MINSAALNRRIICLQAVGVAEVVQSTVSESDAIKCQGITCHVRLQLVLNNILYSGNAKKNKQCKIKMCNLLHIL